MSTSTKPQILVIGSGWAGFYLSSYLDLTKYNLTVISPRRTSAYTPLLASAAVGLFNFYLAEEPVRSKSRSRAGLKFVKAIVLDVDFPSKSVFCRPAFEEKGESDGTAVFTAGGAQPPTTHWGEEFNLSYDILIIAPGCQPNTFHTPGVSQHALFMKNVSDAMAARKLLFDLLEKASLPNVSEEQARELLHVAIVGGGPTGIEMCAELSDLREKEIRDLYPDVADYIMISIYDVAPNILSAYDRKLYEYANNKLVNRKIDIATSTSITRVEQDAMYVKCGKEGAEKRVGYGMLIWATGNKHVDLVGTLSDRVRTPEKGLKRLLTDKNLRVYKAGAEDEAIHDGVFALGDAADIVGSSLPTTAEVAVQKSKYLIDVLHNSSAAPFQYTEKSLVSYIGSHDGIIAGRGDRDGWTGRSAWLAWRSGSLMWTRSWRSRVVIAVTWVLNAVLGKEIAKM